MEYSEKVLDHFMNPRNIGKLEDANATATEGSPACGDQVSFYLKVNEEDFTIEDIKFLSYGCASNIATASITSEIVKGKSLEEAKQLTWKTVTEQLDGLPAIKTHCSVLAVDALKSAIKNFEIEKGLREPEPFNKNTVIEELKKVIYPASGEDIITLQMVKYLNVEGGVVTIELDVPKFCQYKENLVGEIREHLEKFPEVKEIVIS
jgi:nitrogen fixation NifU-like protein